jgi:pimeloyl-ACP methyl ester carboxylesterase
MKKAAKVLLIVLASVLLVLLVGPFLVPVPKLPGTRPPEQLADPSGAFVRINGLNVYTKMAGAGEPAFILLHGFGASLFSWREVMGPLSQEVTVIAYDRPAFGLTERPMSWSGTSPYGTQANLDLLAGLMDHFKIQKVVLIGNSAGGTLAMQFALAHPERVQALVLVDPAVYESGAPSWESILGSTPEMQHMGPLIVRSIRSSGIRLLRTAWHDPSRITPAVMAGYTLPLQAENWDQALWDFTLASQPSGLAEHLKDFRVPVLAITGADDRIVPTAETVRLAGELPGARLAVIPDAGHVPQEEQPGAFLQIVDDFLKGLGNKLLSPEPGSLP